MGACVWIEVSLSEIHCLSNQKLASSSSLFWYSAEAASKRWIGCLPASISQPAALTWSSDTWGIVIDCASFNTWYRHGAGRPGKKGRACGSNTCPSCWHTALSACPPLNPCNQPQPPLRDCVKIMDKNGCVSQRERERKKWDEAVLDSCFGWLCENGDANEF